MARAVGVDISKWQAERDLNKPHGVDFPKLLSKVAFLILRAGYAGSAGGAWTDERVHDYMKDLETMLLNDPKPFTFYWYFRDDISIMDQVNRFSAVVNRYKEVVNLPLIVDAEVFVKSDAVSTQKIIDFQTEVERQTGLLVDILYARSWQLNNETTPGLEKVLPYIFIARYDPTIDPQTGQPWGNPGDYPQMKPRDYDTWLFFQHQDSGGGSDYGVVSAGIDQDVYNGTIEELRSFAGLDKALPPPVDWDEWGMTVADKKLQTLGPGATALLFFSYDVNFEPQILTIQGSHGLKATISLFIDGIDFPLRKTQVYYGNSRLYTFQRDFNLSKGDGVIVELTNSTGSPMEAKVKLALEKYGQ